MCSKGVVLVSYRSVHTRWDQSDRCVIQRTHEREMSAMAKPPLQSKGKKRSSLQVKLQVDKVQCSCPEQFCWSLTASYAVKGLLSSSTGVKEIKILINISNFFILRTLKQIFLKACWNFKEIPFFTCFNQESKRTKFYLLVIFKLPWISSWKL